MLTIKNGETITKLEIDVRGDARGGEVMKCGAAGAIGRWGIAGAGGKCRMREGDRRKMTFVMSGSDGAH